MNEKQDISPVKFHEIQRLALIANETVETPRQRQIFI